MKNLKNKKKIFLQFFENYALVCKGYVYHILFFVYDHETKTWDKFLVMILGVYFWSEMKKFKNFGCILLIRNEKI